MLYRVILALALLPVGAHASQTPKTIQLPLDVTSIIISYILTDYWAKALDTIKYLNRVNKEWHATLNKLRIFKQIVLGIAEKADSYDEISIAKSMRNWPAYSHEEFQEWFKVRSEERELENELFSAAINNESTLIKALIIEKK